MLYIVSGPVYMKSAVEGEMVQLLPGGGGGGVLPVEYKYFINTLFF